MFPQMQRTSWFFCNFSFFRSLFLFGVHSVSNEPPHRFNEICPSRLQRLVGVRRLTADVRADVPENHSTGVQLLDEIVAGLSTAAVAVEAQQERVIRRPFPQRIQQEPTIGGAIERNRTAACLENRQSIECALGDKDRFIAGRIEGLPVEESCLFYTSPSPRDLNVSRMPSSG